MSRFAITVLSLLVILIASTEGRRVFFKNQCAFTIDVEATPGGVLCRGLGSGGGCEWTVPAGGWSGHFHRRNAEGNSLGYPSGTLAEFTFGNSLTASQWNWDWFDISIIPPGCPGSITSYDGCWCNGGSDGYDVGMSIVPLRCQDKKRTCLGRYCGGAYLFPKDDTKTTVCQDTAGDFEIVFCPPGSHVDLGNTALSQTPPCRGGGGNPPPISPPPTLNPPTANPPSGSATCVVDWNIDYWGNDISNQGGFSNHQDCCNYCARVPGCSAWTFAAGTCYAKSSAPSNRPAKSGLVSGTILSRAISADNSDFSESAAAPSGSSAFAIAVIIAVGVIVGLFFILAAIAGVVLATREPDERV